MIQRPSRPNGREIRPAGISHCTFIDSSLEQFILVFSDMEKNMTQAGTFWFYGFR